MTDEAQIYPITRNHAGHVVELNANNWTFKVTGPEFESDRYSMSFNGFRDACEEIDKRIADSKRIKARNIGFSLSVVDGNGSPRRIEKINRANGEIMGIDTYDLYPNVPWVRESLQQIKNLQTQIADLLNPIKPYAIRKSWAHGRIDAERYAEIVERLTTEFDEKFQAAKQAAEPKVEVVK